MADEAILTKRLIISGLTPSISPEALSLRLSSFGKVTSLTGVGALDANGQPRKFAHLTLETTKSKLSRCINVLSGASWKGAKLRVGEARPDFSERNSAENRVALGKRIAEAALEDPLSKKIKLETERKLRKRALRSSKAREASDMTLVMAKNARGRKSWKVMPDGRLIRPVRMRPSHPLPPASAKQIPEDVSQAPVKYKSSSSFSSKMKRISKAPKTSLTSLKKSRNRLTRIRRTVIDPARYGAQYSVLAEEGDESDRIGIDAVPGVWSFDAEGQRWIKVSDTNDTDILQVEPLSGKDHPTLPISTAHESDVLLTEQVSPQTSASSHDHAIHKPSPKRVVSDVSLPEAPSVETEDDVESTAKPRVQSTAIKSSVKDDEIARQLRDEKNSGLAIMRNLLTKGWEVDLDDDDDGAEQPRKIIRRMSESLSDDDEVVQESTDQVNFGVSNEDDLTEGSTTRVSEEPETAETIGKFGPGPEAMDVDAPSVTPRPAVASSHLKSLKDLFAPREEEAGFSLFGNLAASGVDLDELELDEDVEAHRAAPNIAITHLHNPVQTNPAIVPVLRDETIAFDPTAPLFFAIPPSMRDKHLTGTGRKGPRPKDLFDIALERDWPGFWRQSSEDEIRQKWDEVKGDLTREYKKRHREALKRRKRGQGGSLADRETE